MTESTLWKKTPVGHRSDHRFGWTCETQLLEWARLLRTRCNHTLLWQRNVTRFGRGSADALATLDTP